MSSGAGGPVWREVGSRRGVRLRTIGDGPPVVVFPGMEGGGESCLHLVLPVVLPPDSAPRGRVVLVDYEHEDHPTLRLLVDTVTGLLADHLAGEVPATLWGQSFGNALLALVAERGALAVRRTALVSPFTRLSPARVRAARAAVRLTPAPLYRATTPAVARLVFGPVADNADAPFFAALRRTPQRDVLRRVAWLADAHLAVPFTRLDGPLGVWLGDRDRLIDEVRELAFFRALARDDDRRVSVLADCGHVVLPSRAVATACEELAAWLTAPQRTPGEVRGGPAPPAPHGSAPERAATATAARASGRRG